MPKQTEITQLQALSNALRHIRVGDKKKEREVLATVGEVTLPISLHELFVVFTHLENKSLFSEIIVKALNIEPNVPVVFSPDSAINNGYYCHACILSDDPEQDAQSRKLNILYFYKSLFGKLSSSIHSADLYNLYASYIDAADWFDIAAISEFDLNWRIQYPDPEADAAFEAARAFERDAKAAYDALSAKMLAQILPSAVTADVQTAHGNLCPPLSDLTVVNDLNTLQLH